jgi:outer membrane biogenesis lipoprotein LolB
MKRRYITLIAVAASALLTGCATTDRELTQKEKDKMARDMEREDQKRAQAQSKAMRESGQRRTSR